MEGREGREIGGWDLQRKRDLQSKKDLEIKKSSETTRQRKIREELRSRRIREESSRKVREELKNQKRSEDFKSRRKVEESTSRMAFGGLEIRRKFKDSTSRMALGELELRKAHGRLESRRTLEELRMRRVREESESSIKVTGTTASFPRVSKQPVPLVPPIPSTSKGKCEAREELRSPKGAASCVQGVRASSSSVSPDPPATPSFSTPQTAYSRLSSSPALPTEMGRVGEEWSNLAEAASILQIPQISKQPASPVAVPLHTPQRSLPISTDEDFLPSRLEKAKTLLSRTETASTLLSLRNPRVSNQALNSGSPSSSLNSPSSSPPPNARKNVREEIWGILEAANRLLILQEAECSVLQSLSPSPLPSPPPRTKTKGKYASGKARRGPKKNAICPFFGPWIITLKLPSNSLQGEKWQEICKGTGMMDIEPEISPQEQPQNQGNTPQKASRKALIAQEAKLQGIKGILENTKQPSNNLSQDIVQENSFNQQRIQVNLASQHMLQPSNTPMNIGKAIAHGDY